MESVPSRVDEDERVRILLVDDNAANLVALESVLEPLQLELIAAHSGREALDVLAERDCALVLMDIQMPILDGFQTVEAIRKRKELAHLPVMFLTAMFRDQGSAARGYALGAVDFILKPFEPEIIRAKVGAFASLYRYNRRLKQQALLLADETAARHAAERADRMKDEFIAILGHDLRTPLNVIVLTAEAHEHFPDALTPCREAAKRITRSASRMGRLIEDVVDFTRGRLGSGIPLNRQACDLGELSKATLDEIRTVFPACNLTVDVEGDVRGFWDPDRVLQVVANLVGNAALHGGGSVEISIRSDGDSVVFEVHNNGLPIPALKMANLFEPFHPGGRRREGLGLGLYIVNQIVRAHAGTITARSTEQCGTTLTVQLPRHDASRSSEAPG